MSGSVVLVTVHGIGFQRRGYADQLHEHLRAQLGDALGEDPEREHGGPVYVRSEVGGSRREGLARLDPERPLVTVPGTIAHVALVYAPSEPLAPRLGSVADALVRAALARRRYTTIRGLARLLAGDAWAALHQRSGGDAESSLVPRTDPPIARRRTPGMLRALEYDVATYVTRNDLRERVRGFVQAALVALFDRAGRDVRAVVVNAHSQGTVLSWDVLCRLPFHSWRAAGDPRGELLRHLVTAGSPIRKYVDLFAWGGQVGELAAVFDGKPGSPGWTSFWDPHDPVADPLDPPCAWRFGDALDIARPRGDHGLLEARDPGGGATRHVRVADVEVDNVHRSAGGGLQAHDYWNNRSQFVAPLAEILRSA